MLQNDFFVCSLIYFNFICNSLNTQQLYLLQQLFFYDDVFSSAENTFLIFTFMQMSVNHAVCTATFLFHIPRLLPSVPSQ